MGGCACEPGVLEVIWGRGTEGVANECAGAAGGRGPSPGLARTEGGAREAPTGRVGDRPRDAGGDRPRSGLRVPAGACGRLRAGEAAACRRAGHRIGARRVDLACQCFLRFSVRRGRNERILAVDEEALIVWQDVLDMVVNGRPNEVACPHCNHRPLTIEEVDQSTRISCSKCGKFIQGRFTH